MNKIEYQKLKDENESLKKSLRMMRDSFQEMASQHYAINRMIPQTHLDQDFCILYANDLFLEWVGLPMDAVIGENLDSLLHSKLTSSEHEDIRGKRQNNEIWEGEVRGRLRTGKVIWESRIIIPVAESLGELKMLSFHRELTQIKRSQKELEFRNLELNELQKLANLGTVRYRLSSQEFSMSDGVLKILEMEPTDAFTIDDFYKIVHPHDQKQFHKAFQKGMKSIQEEINFRVIRRSGEVCYFYGKFDLINDPLEDQKVLFIFMEDRTDWVLQTQEIKQSLEARKDWLESSDEMYWSLDLFGNVLTCNQAFTKTTKLWFAEELEVGDDFFSQASKAFYFFWEPKVEQALAGEKSSFDFFQEKSTWFVKLNPIWEDNGEVSGVSCIARNVTEERIEQTTLEKAKEEAEEAMRSKSDFLSTMSHEIRTPLNAVVGISDLLIQENQNLEQVENLNLLKFSAENLLLLINDILDFNKLESGNVQLQTDEISLHEMIQRVVKSLDLQAKENGVTVSMDLEGEAETIVLGDSVRLAQIFNNLLSNAIKFSPNGIITIRMKRLFQSHDVEEYLFSVQDTGIGIAPENHALVFERFRQANQSTSRTYGGTGLGLSITRKLVQMMGSDVKLKSELGSGAEFSFALQFRKVSKTQSPKKQIDLDDYLGQGRRILLVDDNKINLNLGKKVLEKRGFCVDLAKDGLEAFKMHSESSYELILMDLQMPVMDGFEATKIIRSLTGSSGRVPIIALTANAFVEIEKEIYAIGMNDIATKPYHPMELIQKVRNCLPPLD